MNGRVILLWMAVSMAVTDMNAGRVSSATKEEAVTLWEGSAAANWDDGLLVTSHEVIGRSGAGDVITVSFDRSGSNPSVKISLKYPWTVFYEGYGVAGSTVEYTLTEKSAKALVGGEMILQGQDCIFRKVTVTSNHGGGDTLYGEDIPAPEIYRCGWLDMESARYFGVVPQEDSPRRFSFMPYAGLGWHWPEGIDISGCDRIDLEYDGPAAINTVFQLQYGEDLKGYGEYGNKGMSRCSLYMSKIPSGEKIHTVAVLSNSFYEGILGIRSITAYDRDGNVWTPRMSGAADVLRDSLRMVSVSYHNLQGIEVVSPEGLVIVTETFEDGSTRSFKKIMSADCPVCVP